MDFGIGTGQLLIFVKYRNHLAAYVRNKLFCYFLVKLFLINHDRIDDNIMERGQYGKG